MAEINTTPEKKESVLTQKDLNKCYWRLSLWGETSTNFERMQAIGFCNAMIPALQKLYPKKEDLSKALKRHLQFFNTELTFGNMILAPTIAMEEEKAKNPEAVSDELITNFKTGTMGPVAAMGDTVNWATSYTLVLALAAAMLAEGSFAGIVVMVVYCILRELEGYLVFRGSYKVGKASFVKFMKSGWINDIMTGATILGMFMVGVLSSSMVSISSTLQIGDFVLQDMLDGFLPGILPLSIVFGIYYLLSKKKVSSAKIVGLIIIICIIGSLVGVL